MKHALFLRLAQRAWFWRAKSFFSRAIFRVNSGAHRLSVKRRSVLASSSAFRTIVATAIPQLFLGFLAAFLSQYFNSSLSDFYELAGWKKADEGVYGTLLGGIASIGAVFIGLYYAGITAVGAAKYSSLPSSIRNMLVSEVLGSAYMRFLALLTFYSLSMLCLHALGYAQVPIAIPFLMLFSGVGIVGFIHLGNRAFAMFDPINISAQTFAALVELIQRVQAGGFRWRDLSFQAHARREALAHFETIAALRIAWRKDPSAALPVSQIQLLRAVGTFLQHYVTAKRSVPTESHWYPRTFEHPAWYQTRDSEVSIAHATLTPLKPREVVDFRWVEELLEPELIESASEYLAADRFSELKQLFAILEQYIHSLAIDARTNDAFDFARRLGQRLLTEAIAKPHNVPESLQLMDLCEAIGTLPSHVCVYYGESASDLLLRGLKVPLTFIAKKGMRFYKTDIPKDVLNQLEKLSENLNFELDVEGNFVSPEWYIRELTSLAAAKLHAANVISLCTDPAKLYDEWLVILASSGRNWLFAGVASRKREFTNKLAYQWKNIADTWSKLTSDKRVPGLQWAKLNLDELAARREQQAAADRSKETSVLRNLMNVARPKNFPDYFGQYLHYSGEQIFENLVRNRPDNMKAYLDFYFTGCLHTFQNTLTDLLLSSREDYAFQIAAAPLLDLMDLSGYAILFSAVYGDDELQNPFKALWNVYFGQQVARNESPFAARIAALYLATRSPLNIPHRGILRTSWQQRAVGMIYDKLKTAPPEYLDDKVVKHPVALVRIFASGPWTSIDGIDIFAELFLAMRADVDSSKLNRRDLKERISRETKRWEQDE